MVSPNKGTLKICAIGSNKGIFPLFIRFPYLKNFDEISPKSPKPRTEIDLSDHSCQESSIFGNLRGLLLKFIVQKVQVLSRIGRKFTCIEKLDNLEQVR